MSNTEQITVSGSGTCLCKAVSFSANSISQKVGVCHFNMCRTWSGGPYIGIDCGSDVQFNGEVARYKSSEWAERGFCCACGTHLFYRFIESGTMIMPAGVFNEGLDLVMDHQIFIDEKPHYYDFANQTQNMTGAEVMKMFASSN